MPVAAQKNKFCFSSDLQSKTQSFHARISTKESSCLHSFHKELGIKYQMLFLIREPNHFLLMH